MAQSVNNTHEIILRRIRDIPSLPEVVNKMIQLLGEPNTPASQIAQLISYDPGLTSKVLRLVNSAAYGFQRQISSIQHGIMILGFNTVRGLVLSASIFKMFEGQAGNARGLDHYHFWRHSLGTAMAARLILQAVKGKDPRFADTDDAFSAGMLHDIGKVVLDVYFSAEYCKVAALAEKDRLMPHGPAYLNLEERLLQTNHSIIGAYLAVKWKLPVGIAEVIEHHHCPSEARYCKPLVYLVALANQLALVLYEYKGIFNRDFFSQEILEYFEFSDDDLVSFLTLLKEDIDSADDLLASISGKGDAATRKA